MINSRPRITASVTIAPITPATAFEMPPPELAWLLPSRAELDGELSLCSTYGEQTPVELPQALHHDSWSPIAMFFMPLTKSFHGRGDLLLPNRGYSVGVELWDVVPLWKRKRTETWLGSG